MDGYFGSDIDDFIVPKNQELSSYMDSWSKCCMDPQENSRMPNKCLDVNFNRDELNFNGECFYDEVDVETSFIDKDQSSGSSGCGGLSGESHCLAVFSCDRPDYQLNDFAGTEQMDEIFLNSLFEDSPGSENPQNSFCVSHESNSFMKDMALDSQSIICDEHMYPPSCGWDKRAIIDSEFYPCNSEQNDFPPMQALLLDGMSPPQKNSQNGYDDEETLLEESVLQELEMVMLQFTEGTRLCFRDSFYRLAKNSRQQHMVMQSLNKNVFLEESLPRTSLGRTLRSGRKKATESRTNTIDRAIANIMFNKMKSNVQDIPHSTIANFEQEVFKQNKHKPPFPISHRTAITISPQLH